MASPLVSLTATAWCLGCDWVPEGDDPAAVDRQAAKHVKAGHPTAIVAVPA